MDWPRDNKSEKIHPTQKPVKLLETLIEIFTDPGDVVIDPVAGSGSTLVAAENLGRKSYGFEIKKNFYRDAQKWIKQVEDVKKFGYDKTAMESEQNLFSDSVDL